MPADQAPETVTITDRMADCAGDTMAVYGHVKSITGNNASVTLVAEAFDKGSIIGERETTLDVPGNETASFMIWIPGGCPSLQVDDFSVHIEEGTF